MSLSLEEAATELTAAAEDIGRNVTGVQGDVSDLDDLDRFFAKIKQEKGRLDVVFANAGTAKYAPVGEILQNSSIPIFDINVRGLLFTIQKALPLLPDGASIVLCASVVASKGLASNSTSTALPRQPCSLFARTWATDLEEPPHSG